jgi:hypothetical protein
MRNQRMDNASMIPTMLMSMKMSWWVMLVE